MAILGCISIGVGYWIAITTKNPLGAVNLFFVAVLLVIVGTYLLFAAGSIAVLKLLRSRKEFYYQPRHFIAVSGMIYRMKQNAVGLANICILLSANLGVLNLLPLPALDGGRLLFCLIEVVRGKPVNQEYEAMVHGIGLILLLGLSMVILFKDIWQLLP